MRPPSLIKYRGRLYKRAARPPQPSARLFARLEKLAKEHIPGIDTLKTRNSDRLDFHDVGVASIVDAMHAAYLMGIDDEVRNISK